MATVAVIGAGPYGLSVAADLLQRGHETRIFGKPMGMWRDHMPEGMALKSDGFASNLAAPDDGLTLRSFCQMTDQTYGDLGFRCPLETIVAYGLEFQRRYIGQVEEEQVINVARAPTGFSIALSDGEIFYARHVVVATGLIHYKSLPTIPGIPPERLTHASEHHDLTPFIGKRVIIIGAGQSAFETAALLHEKGADVRVLSRRPPLWFDPDNESVPSAWNRFRHPNFGLGPGWRSYIWSEQPRIFSWLPAEYRMKKAFSTFGPAGSGWLKHRVVGVMPTETGEVRSAAMQGDEIQLSVRTADKDQTMAADHVIAATGYKPDIRRLPFLKNIQAEIQCLSEGIPKLARGFESSVAGLHFVGNISAPAYGPSMRFIYGTRFTARHLSAHLASRRANDRLSNAHHLNSQPA